MEFLKTKNDELIKLCRNFHVLQLYLFGSQAKGTFRENSDIDLLVYFDKINLLDYADNYFDFFYSLEKLFNKKIDLVSGKALKNPYFIKEIENTKQLIYDINNQKIAF
jgi:hypothetical protein